MMKLLLLPFRVVFHILRAIFFPSYLRWVFRMHWVVYFGLAAGVGYVAYEEYQTYLFNRLEAELQITDGPPAAIPLSKWSADNNTPYNDEVTIRGIYFAALEQGEFDPIGMTQEFIMLADDQGREVKAVLVVWPSDMEQLQRQLAAQGNGDRITVTVNGSLNTSSDWARSIATEVRMMGVPSAQDLVIVEPFIGDRSLAITERAEKTFGTVAIFGGLAGLLAVVGIARMLFGRERGKADTAMKTHQTARGATHLHETPQPVGIPEASPWGTFKPVTPPPANSPKTTTKPQKQNRARDPKQDATPPQPDFKSVFPGGGSAFRFKTADQIILQSFGTLSKLTTSKPRN